MKIYDISMSLKKEMPVWPGDNQPIFDQYSFINK